MNANKTLRGSLLTDGSSDRVLLPIVRWALWQRRTLCHLTWADPRVCGRTRSLAERVRRALDCYPCDVLFVHRDAEARPREERLAEIRTALDGNTCGVCVVPVRMQEAWLLFDEAALREAAGNPRGQVRLDLPKLAAVERLADPKKLLYDLLRQASERYGRRLRKFQPDVATHRLAQIIEDYSPLRQLPAFQAFEDDLSAALMQIGAPHAFQASSPPRG
jgi:hypothetical protein